METRGSAYLPSLNAFYICDFQMAFAAEEAARFLHHACRGLPSRVNGHGTHALAGHQGDSPTLQEDRFYSRAVENALAYFGSRVLCPARPALRDTDLFQLYDETREDLEQQISFNFPELIKMIDFLVLHRQFEVDPGHYSELPQPLQEGIQSGGSKFEHLTQQLGYLLGSDLYDAYLEGRATRAAVRHAFLTHLEEPGSARAAYLSLAQSLRGRAKQNRNASSI